MSFLVAVRISSKLLSYIYYLSEYLQSENIDLVNALDRVSKITAILQDLRENSTVKFNDIYKKVKCLAALINLEKKTPQIFCTQKNPQNVLYKDVNEFYKQSIFIPYLDDLSSIYKRFYLKTKQLLFYSIHYIFQLKINHFLM